MNERLLSLGLTNCIRIHDISALLSNFNTAFHERFEYWCKQFSNDPLIDGLSQSEYECWLASMKASVNTRKLNLSYEQMQSVFGSEITLDEDRYRLNERSRWALIEYRALKTAAADLQWEDRFFPGAVRATIHTKQIPVLGLRIYPEYKFSSTLLPYHGIGVLSKSERNGQYKLTIEPELFVCGSPIFTRVSDDAGTTWFYQKNDES